MSDYDREKFAFDKMEERDPRKMPIIGLDKVLVSTVGLGIVAAFNLAGKAVSPWIGHAALGSFAAFMGSLGYRVGKDTKERAIAAEALEA
jgi:hypothetical protein